MGKNKDKKGSVVKLNDPNLKADVAASAPLSAVATATRISHRDKLMTKVHNEGLCADGCKRNCSAFDGNGKHVCAMAQTCKALAAFRESFKTRGVNVDTMGSWVAKRCQIYLWHTPQAREYFRLKSAVKSTASSAK